MHQSEHSRIRNRATTAGGEGFAKGKASPKRLAERRARSLDCITLAAGLAVSAALGSSPQKSNVLPSFGVILILARERKRYPNPQVTVFDAKEQRYTDIEQLTVSAERRG